MGDMGGGEVPPPPGPEPGGEAGVTPESKRRDNMNILLESNDLINEDDFIDLSRARNSLGVIGDELDRILND
jgi:hypothetical protein